MDFLTIISRFSWKLGIMNVSDMKKGTYDEQMRYKRVDIYIETKLYLKR
jgi:hypothetical protein